MRIGSWLSRLFHPNRASTPPALSKPTPPASTTPVDTFEPSAPMRVSLGQVSGYSATERAKLDEATGLLAKVLNSREFRDGVLNATFNGRPGFAGDARTPAEIYATIRAGQENYTVAADGEVDLNLELKNFSWFQRNVVGYTTESSDTLTINRSFFSAYTPAEVAGNLAHEWLHKLGFEHDFKATARRPDSVPYELGELVERLAQGSLTPL